MWSSRGGLMSHIRGGGLDDHIFWPISWTGSSGSRIGWLHTAGSRTCLRSPRCVRPKGPVYKNRVFSGGTPFWGTFWPFWAFWLKSRYAIGSLRKSSLLPEPCTPLGATAEVVQKLHLVSTVPCRSKKSIRATSTATPRGVCTVLVAGLTSVDFQ